MNITDSQDVFDTVYEAKSTLVAVNTGFVYPSDALVGSLLLKEDPDNDRNYLLAVEQLNDRYTFGLFSLITEYFPGHEINKVESAQAFIKASRLIADEIKSGQSNADFLKFADEAGTLTDECLDEFIGLAKAHFGDHNVMTEEFFHALVASVEMHFPLSSDKGDEDVDEMTS